MIMIQMYMVKLEQLYPYYEAFGPCVISVWLTFFIFLGFKIGMQIYLVLSEKIGMICCNDIRKFM